MDTLRSRSGRRILIRIRIVLIISHNAGNRINIYISIGTVLLLSYYGFLFFLRMKFTERTLFRITRPQASLAYYGDLGFDWLIFNIMERYLSNFEENGKRTRE